MNLANWGSGDLAIDDLPIHDLAIGDLMPYLFLKDSKSTDRITIVVPRPEDDDTLIGIRCPLCTWRPAASSRWYCLCIGTPEPFFFGCGTTWNTFLTQAVCPGCHHHWQWTTCLQCGGSSPHVDWYEDDPGAPPQ